MPFDFANNKTYTVDYKGIFNEIMERKILLDINLQFNYLNRWIKLLRKHDDMLVKQFSTREQIIEFTARVQNEPEIFRFPIHWENSTIFLHFHI
jgi:hypothetical protein